MTAEHLARAWAARVPVRAVALRPAEVAALVEALRRVVRRRG